MNLFLAASLVGTSVVDIKLKDNGGPCSRASSPNTRRNTQLNLNEHKYVCLVVIFFMLQLDMGSCAHYQRYRYFLLGEFGKHS